jgi:steroid 5-alpha reductase family enzyme
MTGTTLAAMAAAQWLAFAVVMAAAWLLQQRSGNSGWVDVSWTFGLGAIGAASALMPLAPPAVTDRQVLVAVLAVVWALRLGLQILQRTLSTDDDPRYADLARQWGRAAPVRMIGFLQVQAAASVPLLATILIAAHRPGADLTVGDWLAGLLMLIAIAGEGLADRQLVAFKRDAANAGKVCDIGLWRWSRHPNYFFQWIGWLAYPLIAIDTTGLYTWGWLALAGPVCMYILLVHVSGIPPLEAHLIRSRGDAYRAYQARTSAFFPWPPAQERLNEHRRHSHSGVRDNSTS